MTKIYSRYVLSLAHDVFGAIISQPNSILGSLLCGKIFCKCNGSFCKFYRNNNFEERPHEKNIEPRPIGLRKNLHFEYRDTFCLRRKCQIN